MSIHDETEADTRANRIDPVLKAAGWGQNGSKVRREILAKITSSQVHAKHAVFLAFSMANAVAVGRSKPSFRESVEEPSWTSF